MNDETKPTEIVVIIKKIDILIHRNVYLVNNIKNSNSHTYINGYQYHKTRKALRSSD